MPDEEGWSGPLTPDCCRGQYLCEVCEEAMTDDIWPGATNPTGLDLAICAHCQAMLRSGTLGQAQGRL